jgi:hypothetical protein
VNGAIRNSFSFESTWGMPFIRCLSNEKWFSSDGPNYYL